MNARESKRLAWRVWWCLLAALALYYLWVAVHSRFIRPDRLGPDLWNKQFWYGAHLAGALPVLLAGAIQFVPSLRAARPGLHRFAGRAYVFGATVAALTAAYLGAVIEYEGSRLPIVLLASLWLFFTLSAWRCAVRKNFRAHRLFMIRSFGLALVLVWLRLMYDAQDWLFFYVKDETLRDATREWASWVVPLLALEFALSWWPLLRSHTRSP